MRSYRFRRLPFCTILEQLVVTANGVVVARRKLFVGANHTSRAVDYVYGRRFGC